MPVTMLTLKAPNALAKKKIAIETWHEIISLQNETQAAKDGTPIITSFDKRILIKYCLAEDECDWLLTKIKDTEEEAASISKTLKRLKPTKSDDGGWKLYLNLLKQYNALNSRVVGLDARLDGKRKMLHSLAQSLYLTPRSRAGVAPAEKEQEDTGDPMAAVLKG